MSPGAVTDDMLGRTKARTDRHDKGPNSSAHGLQGSRRHGKINSVQGTFLFEVLLMRMRDVSRGRSASRSLTGLALGIAAVSVLLVGHAGPAAAQTGFIPYFGKNNIHYDTFEWKVYQTDHFEIYYYPELEKHLERIAGYAESAYQKVSADLHHDLSSKVPMILFKTHSEFEQQNVIPGAAQEGVGAFVESSRGRMLLPIDDPPDRLYGLIVARADALLRERHHPAGAHPARRSAVGDGGVVGLRARRLGPRGPDDGAGRGRRPTSSRR